MNLKKWPVVLSLAAATMLVGCSDSSGEEIYKKIKNVFRSPEEEYQQQVRTPLSQEDIENVLTDCLCPEPRENVYMIDPEHRNTLRHLLKCPNDGKTLFISSTRINDNTFSQPIYRNYYSRDDIQRDLNNPNPGPTR